ncbi:MAG: metallophosphoesterase, partial [Alphaproteobacteria bacterium]
MSKFFDEAVIFTDIHFGLKNNSKMHNNDCLNFIKWMIEEAHSRNIKKCFFLGDWHHHRATINVGTLNYTVDALQILNDNFDEVHMIMGNHDLYYREKRDINSLPFANKYPNINIINDEIFEE